MEELDKTTLDLPIWIVNLEKDIDKRQFMEDQLRKLELNYEIIPAIDGKLLSENDLVFYSKTIALRDFGRELTPGELGCANSHIKLWHSIVDHNYDEVLILEDDIHIGRDLVDILRHRDKLPSDYQHINFSTKAKQRPIGDFVFDIFRASNHIERAYSTEAYLLTNSGARKLLDLVYPLYMPIDNFISIADIVSYGIYPKVAVSGNFSSGIGQRWTNIPKLSFGQKKWQQFKEILKSIAIFFGATEQGLINLHLKINKILKR